MGSAIAAKRCSRCHVEKPATLDYFPRAGSRAYLSSWCRKCSSKAAMESAIRGGYRPSTDPLKALALRFGTARKGSLTEEEARARLIAAVLNRPTPEAMNRHGGTSDRGAHGVPTPGSFAGLENREEVIAKPRTSSEDG